MIEGIGEWSSEENIEMRERGSKGREGWRTLHNEELRNMYYYSPLVTAMINFHFDNCAAFINHRATLHGLVTDSIVN
jgi:hypothetical protein